jgi:hypothetical protein
MKSDDYPPSTHGIAAAANFINVSRKSSSQQENWTIIHQRTTNPEKK